MGADLYIQSINEAQRAVWRPKFDRAVEIRTAFQVAGRERGEERAQKRVEATYEKLTTENLGYFRDSYNASSIFNLVGLSWWQHVGPLLDDEGRLSVVHTQLIKILFGISWELFIKGDGFNGEVFKIEFAESSDGLESWQEYFEAKAVKFIEFLDRAIALDEPIYCSV